MEKDDWNHCEDELCHVISLLTQASRSEPLTFRTSKDHEFRRR
ncbi:hypothetical protein N507_1191 [Lacticaseibacillus rhamnosus DSM 14870]|nr:hypothetical protein N507_1191 [Lacticaseibacillus rhamnosus DSM 14870]